MPRRTRIQIAKPEIIDFFNSHAHNAFKTSDIGKAFRENRDKWKLAKSMNRNSFIEFLIDNDILKRHQIDFPSEVIKIYTLGENSTYSIACRLWKNAYISHFTAMFLNELTEQVPKTIYTTVPNLKKKEQLDLTNEEIEESFSKPFKKTSYISEWDNMRIVRLHGVDYGNLGIVQTAYMDKSILRVSNLERTLIDIVIRPEYGGGIEQVKKAFELAKGRISTNRLVSTLRRMELSYPYHQSIGFLMEAAGYPERSLQLIKKIPIKKKFYLHRQIEDPQYVPEWKLFIPKGI